MSGLFHILYLKINPSNIIKSMFENNILEILNN